MTISALTRKASFSCNGVTVDFPFTFPIIADDDLVVDLISSAGVVTTLTLTTDYEVAGENGLFVNGGVVTTVTYAGGSRATYAWASGYTLVVYRATPLTQEADYERNKAFNQDILEQNLDKLTMIVQEIQETVDRCAKAPVSDTSPDMELPSASERANCFPAFNAQGDVFASAGPSDVPVSTYAEGLVQAEDLAELLVEMGADEDIVDGLGLDINLIGMDFTDLVDKDFTNLAAFADLDGDADKLPYFTGEGEMSLADFSALARDVIAETTAAAMRSVLGVLDQSIVPQTVQSAFCDAHGYPDFLWNGQEDFAVTKMRTTAPPDCDPIENNHVSTYHARFAFDGDNTGISYWASAETTGGVSGVSWVGMKNLKRNIKAIKYLNYSSANNTVTSVKVDYSTDGGVTWTNIQTTTVSGTASVWNEITVAAYAGGDAGLHAIRLLANSNCASGSWTVPTIILLYNSNLDVCTTGNAVKYDENASYPAVNAFNNYTATTTYASAANMNGGLLYLGQSGLASAVKAVRIYNYSGAGNLAKEVRLSWKQNVGDSWIDLATIALDTTTTIWQTISVPSYSPSGSHYFALRPTTNCAAAVWNVNQLEFYCGDDTAISMTASATDPLALVHSSGTDNYITEVTSSEASLVSSLVPGRTHFVYADRNAPTGAITYGSKPVCPQYGKEFDATKHCLLHFEGADASTTITDEYGSTWTVNGNAQLDNNATPGPSIGTTYLRLDGTGDSIKNTDRYWFNGQPFTIEGWWFTANQATANQMVMSTIHASGYPVYLRYTSANLFGLQLSSNNSSMDICDSTAAYTVANNTWYKFIFEWDGYYYRVWIGISTATMVLIFNVKSSTPLYTGQVGLEFGGYNSGAGNPVNGGFDEIRITLGSNRYGWSPVAEVAAFDKYDSDMTYFDINKMKMYYGGGTSWTEVQRLFLGEGYMDAHGVTDMRNYALQGKYDGPYVTPLPATTTSFEKRHNLGCSPRDTRLRLRNIVSEYGWYPGDEASDPGWNGGSYIQPTNIWSNRKSLGARTGDAGIFYLQYKNAGDKFVVTAAKWEYKFVAQRGW